jgi:3-methyladenine DNA glycosylase AlkD
VLKIEQELIKLKNPQKAKDLARFFKTKKGEYGEGDFFLGITVPKTREIAKKHSADGIKLTDLQKVLKSKYHEIRLAGLLILVDKFKKAEKLSASEREKEQKKIVDFYLKNTRYINNWDLVDLSCHYVLGAYLLKQKDKSDRKILFKLAKSKNILERRIGIVSTFAFIYAGEYKTTFEISEILLKDEHDLIHKAVGWMLREVGKRVSEKELENFLKKNGKTMPRTALRYAIERLPENKRQFYLNLKFKN